MQSSKAAKERNAPRFSTQNMKSQSSSPNSSAVKYEVIDNIKEEQPFMLEILDSTNYDAQFYEFTNFDNNTDASDGTVITHDSSEGFNESTTDLDNNSEVNALSDRITTDVPESIHEEVDEEESLIVVRDDFDIDLDWVHVVVNQEKTDEQGREKNEQETPTKDKRKTEFKNRSLQCDTCKKIFSKTKMKAHKCSGPVDKDGVYKIYYVCDLCPLSFKKMEELDLHKQLHASGFRYQCDLCDKWFLYLYQFRNHMRRHNLHYKRYRCEVCKKCFAAEISFNSHKMTHYQ